MDIARDNRRFNWQQKGWPAATGAVVAEGKVEHRGSKKAGGYYARQKGKS